jgi:hypothetical protein
MPAYPLFNYEKIAKAYKVFGSTRHVAKLIGCSNFTVAMAIRKLGVKASAQGLTPENRWKNGKPPGTVAKWSEAHPEVDIPLKPKAIENLVGCTRKDAYHYLEWRRKYFSKKIDKLPDLRPYLGEAYTLKRDMKNFRIILELTASKRRLSLYERELESVLARLT